MEEIGILTDSPFPLNLNCKASRVGHTFLIEDKGEFQGNGNFGNSLAGSGRGRVRLFVRATRSRMSTSTVMQYPQTLRASQSSQVG